MLRFGLKRRIFANGSLLDAKTGKKLLPLSSLRTAAKDAKKKPETLIGAGDDVGTEFLMAAIEILILRERLEVVK